jgi:restriction system protein
MPIPDYQSLMLPLLKFAGDRKEHSKRETAEFLARQFNLTDDDLRTMLASDRQSLFDNRVGWASTYIKHAGLLESTRRAHFRITERGLNVLKEKPTAIDVKYLDRFEEFKIFRTLKKEKPEGQALKEVDQEKTPEEVLESAYQNLREELAQDLLQQIKTSPPALFERIVVELLVAMGYGGSRKDAGEALGKSGDEGIDGIIKEDRLGLDIIYLQAKRWEGPVSRPEIQKFAGALQGKHARKGIFITTSGFTKEAIEFAARIDSKIVLIDGVQLTGLMIDHNIGVAPVASYEIKRIDTDYFTEA